jgi:hypothetical protein
MGSWEDLARARLQGSAGSSEPAQTLTGSSSFSFSAGFVFVDEPAE